MLVVIVPVVMDALVVQVIVLVHALVYARILVQMIVQVHALIGATVVAQETASGVVLAIAFLVQAHAQAAMEVAKDAQVCA